MDQSDSRPEPRKQGHSDQLRHLRDLVVGPTAESVRQLREEIRSRKLGADELSDVLPAAIRKSAQSKDFARSLAPTLSQAFEDSVKRDPKALADAIAPIMGPAIRRSISEQIRAMVQSLNTVLDHSLSPRGIRWRIEAWRTGKPFAEVVLLHTLVYRIEQLLLIHPKTGLLMQSVSADADDDADLVSALLSALQDFIRDSFEHQSSQGADLKTMDTNELRVWIEHGPAAILVAAIRGEPPLSLREKIQETLEQIHLDQSQLLTNFNGDTAPLEIVRPDLEQLLLSEFKERKPTQPKLEPPRTRSDWNKHLRWALPTALLLVIAGWGLSAKHQRYQRQLAAAIDLPPSAELQVAGQVLRITGEARHEWIAEARNRLERIPEITDLDVSKLVISDQPWAAFLRRIESEPGITITATQRDGDRYLLRGWRDPLAADPRELMKQVGLEPSSVAQQWEPYRTLDPWINLKRLKKIMAFPRTVTSAEINGASGTLVLKGEASREWIQKLQYTWDLLETGLRLDLNQLSQTEDSD